MFNFEKLDVWKEAIQFAGLVYELTGDFPREERSNLAEGSSRVSLNQRPSTVLRWRAAEGAGEGRCDVGRGYDLLGRFFRRHFLTGRR